MIIIYLFKVNNYNQANFITKILFTLFKKKKHIHIKTCFRRFNTMMGCNGHTFYANKQAAMCRTLL